MGKIKGKVSGRGPIAQKVIKALKKHSNQKIYDLEVYRNAKLKFPFQKSINSLKYYAATST